MNFTVRSGVEDTLDRWSVVTPDGVVVASFNDEALATSAAKSWSDYDDELVTYMLQDQLSAAARPVYLGTDVAGYNDTRPVTLRE